MKDLVKLKGNLNKKDSLLANRKSLVNIDSYLELYNDIESRSKEMERISMELKNSKKQIDIEVCKVILEGLDKSIKNSLYLVKTMVQKDSFLFNSEEDKKKVYKENEKKAIEGEVVN